MTRIGAILIGVLACLPSLQAAEKWLKLTSPNFELYTTAGEKKARQTIDHFEQLHDFFYRTLNLKTRRVSRPVCLVGFRSMKQSREYREARQAVGYYLRGPRREYVLLGEVEGEQDPVAVHEYVHVLVDRAELKIPLWLNEGLAEFYSTMAQEGRQVVLGRPPFGRRMTLNYHGWMKIDRLVDPSEWEEFRQDPEDMHRFYAQSWFLVHMLTLSPDYRTRFPDLVLAFHEGLDAAAAFDRVYGQSLGEVEKRLRQYFRDRIYSLRLDAELRSEAAPSELVALQPDEVDVLLANLLEYRGEKEEAAARFRELEARSPRSWRVQEALGYRELARGSSAGAAEHFALAVEHGCPNPDTWFDYAGVLYRSEGASEQVADLLRRTVEQDPANAEAQLQLGLTLAELRHYDEALVHLVRMRAVKPDQAPSFFQAAALCYHAAGNLTEARKSAERALEHSRDELARRRSQDILDYVTRQERAQEEAAAEMVPDRLAAAVMASRTVPPPPPEPPAIRPEGSERPRLVRRPVQPDLPKLAGEFYALDCLGETARLKLRVDGKTVNLAIYEPGAVRVRGNAASGILELGCGPQEPRQVVIEYIEMIDKELQTIGSVRTIQFQ